MTQPLVSICIPTYNGQQFIAEAMESAIAQTYPNLEIIVSDDDSKDATLNIIKSFSVKTSIPIHIYHHEPRGIGANWNHCIKKANGAFIKFLFQDDVLVPACIEELVPILVRNKTVSIIASKRELIIEDSYPLDRINSFLKTYGDLQSTLTLSTDNNLSILDKSLFKSSKFFNSPLNKVGEPSATLIRKAIFKKSGFFRENLKQILDYEFYYRVLKYNDILIYNKELVRFRLHANQASSTNIENIEDRKYFQKEIYYDFFLQLPKSRVLAYYKSQILKILKII